MLSAATRDSKPASSDFVTPSWQHGTSLPSLSKMKPVFDVTIAFISITHSVVKYVGQGELPQNSSALSSLKKLQENYYEYF